MQGIKINNRTNCNYSKEVLKNIDHTQAPIIMPAATID